jgi:hypothetical protein
VPFWRMGIEMVSLRMEMKFGNSVVTRKFTGGQKRVDISVYRDGDVTSAMAHGDTPESIVGGTNETHGYYKKCLNYPAFFFFWE